MLRLLIIVMAIILPGCAAAFEAPETVSIPAGPFAMGSTASEREMAYLLDEEAYGHSVTRKQGWYDSEPRKSVMLPSYDITRTVVTNMQYQEFVAETGHAAPKVEPRLWASYRLIHPYQRTVKFQWQDGKFPKGREDHPVVLVSYEDATAYARWLSEKTGGHWRLPTEAEWEKAARGTEGRIFPWGDKWDPARLNSHDHGPFETVPVGQFPAGVSPFGMMDGAGQVFEWTATPRGKMRMIVKGGSWDDKGCGVCRPAARHSRPRDLKHILIGFRLVQIVD